MKNNEKCFFQNIYFNVQGEKDLGELTNRVRKLQTEGYKNRRGKYKILKIIS